MIISRTPLRMSFFGGGSDLSAYYSEHRGAVVSTALNKYIFVTLNPKFDQGIRVAYSRTEEVESVDRIEHALVRSAMNLLRIPGGVEITTVADIPSRGTGLGSSSSFTIALLHALYAHKGQHVNAERLAAEACHIEIDICGEPIGKQDQYAAAFGGFNLIEFLPDERVVVSPIICKKSTKELLQSNLLLLYTGVTRSASNILKDQTDEIKASRDKRSTLSRMVEICYDVKREIESNNLDAFGDLLHETRCVRFDVQVTFRRKRE